MIVIANVFPKLQTVKNLFRTLFKRRRLRAYFDSQPVKASQILAKSPWEHYFYVYSSFGENLNLKMSPLVLPEILEVFVNTLSGDAKYPIQDCENLQLASEMQLS